MPFWAWQRSTVYNYCVPADVDLLYSLSQLRNVLASHMAACEPLCVPSHVAMPQEPVVATPCPILLHGSL